MYSKWGSLQITVLGVVHTKGGIGGVIRWLTANVSKGHKVAIELNQDMLNRFRKINKQKQTTERFETRSSLEPIDFGEMVLFWHAVIKFCDRCGIKLVPVRPVLPPPLFSNKKGRELDSQTVISLQEKQMARKIARENPDVVIVGALHANQIKRIIKSSYNIRAKSIELVEIPIAERDTAEKTRKRYEERIMKRHGKSVAEYELEMARLANRIRSQLLPNIRVARDKKRRRMRKKRAAEKRRTRRKI